MDGFHKVRASFENVVVIKRTHFCAKWQKTPVIRSLCEPMKTRAIHRIHLDTESKKSTSRRNMLEHNILDTICVQM